MFLAPPVNDDDEVEENANRIKMAIQKKLDNKDLRLLTKMDITIPMKTSELRYHVKNYRGCAGRLLGQKSLAYESLSSIFDHIEDKETSYNYEFKRDTLFGGSFLDRVNWRFHRFLDSCASGVPSDIDTKKLDFSDMLEQVERREYQTKIPSCIRKIMKKKETSTTPEDNKIIDSGGGSGGGQGGGGHRKCQESRGNGCTKQANNNNICSECKLGNNEPFRDIFTLQM